MAIARSRGGELVGSSGPTDTKRMRWDLDYGEGPVRLWELNCPAEPSVRNVVIQSAAHSPPRLRPWRQKLLCVPKVL